MRATAGLAWFVGAAALLSACGGSGPAPTPAPSTSKPMAMALRSPSAKPPAPAAPVQAATVVKAADEVLAPARPRYDVKGRRDPFENLEVRQKEKEASTGFNLAAAKLTGIVRGTTVLALVETADGMGYVLKVGDTLGDGRLIEIGQNAALFSIPPKPGSTANRVVLKITTD